MSLRRRITLAVAAGVAVIMVVLSALAYASVRSHLRGEIDSQLISRARPTLGPHAGSPDGGDHGGPTGASAQSGPRGPGDVIPGPPDRFGGAPGYFQFVHQDGTVFAQGGVALLPVSRRDVQIARSGSGRYFADVTVRGTHLRVLTVADPIDRTAVQVALPLTNVDKVLHGLLFTFLGLILAAALLAAVLGGLVGRAALAPIGRFIRRTESVSGGQAGSERIEETGPVELRRLAASFNRTLDALERSVDAQRHLVADASHELRTPIAALRSNIQIFLEGERLPEHERREMQASIIAELDELTQLVADVVELARGAEPDEQARLIRLDEIVEEAVARSRRRWSQVKLEVDLEPTAIEHAPERVARAVGNILDNARKWSPEGGVIEVGLRQGVLTVRDHGPGFKEEDLPHVFDRFYRAAGARRMPGSGLGLAIVRQAAEERGGWVRAENAPGGGALMRACFGPPLPAAREAMASPDEFIGAP